MILETFATFIQKILLFSAYINNNSSFKKPLTSEEEAKYLEQVKLGDINAKNILIEHNLRLVAHIVKKYSNTEEADDLISVGSLGLIKAINTFEYGHGTQFSTYAARCIENEILMLLRVNKKHRNTISVEDSISSDPDENDMTVIDLQYSDELNVEKEASDIILSEKIITLMKQYLTKREYIILCMRFGLNGTSSLTQREVAKKLGISRSYISRLETKAIETLHKYMNKIDYL